MSMERIICPACGSEEILIGKKWCICDECGKRFAAPAVDSVEPLKLFFSYSHMEEEICRRILKVFEKRGHKIWFDREKISFGDDWREKIMEGILSSNGVIAFLSKNSVRDPGVCLNELSIAVAVKGGNIQTVLLEPEGITHPPASVSHRQWLDMSRWREELAKGDDSFRLWFDKKIDELLRVVESKENRSFSGQITSIKEALPLINYNTSKQRDLMLQAYVGRRWLTEKVEQWLNDQNLPSICVLYGDPGIGKSAFAANYCHFNEKVIAGIFCEYNRVNFKRTESAIQTLAYLLSCRMPEYRVLLADILRYTPEISNLDPPAMFDRLLTVPLTECSIDGTHEIVCIVIDGLDECGTHESNILADILSQFAPRLPKWLRILITARKTESVRLALADTPFIDLCGDTVENTQDIKDYFRIRLREKNISTDQLDYLAEKSGGIFLYAKLISEAILAGKMTVDDSTEIPEGLSGAFSKWFDWFFPDRKEYAQNFRLPVGVLAASPEPLPVKEFLRLFSWDENTCNDFMKRIRILLREGTNLFEEDTVEFTHKYLKDWLDCGDAGAFQSTHASAIRYMGKTCSRLYRYEPRSATRYELQYMFSFLRESELYAEIDECIKTPDLYFQINEAGNYCLIRGKTNKALEIYESARAFAEYCLARSDAPDFRLMYSISELKLAEIAEAQGELKKMTGLYQHCYEVRKQLVLERGNDNDQKCFGVVCERMADLYIAKGDHARARELLEEGLQIREKLNKMRGSAEDKRNLGSNLFRLAEVIEAEGNTETADKLFFRCLEIRREQLELRQSAVDYKDLIVTLIRKATFDQHMGRIGLSGELIAEACELAELLTEESEDMEVRRAISYCYLYRGQYYKHKGEFRKVEEDFDRSIRVRKRIVADRGSAEDFWNLGGAYFLKALLKVQFKQFDEARQLVLQILEIDLELYENRGKMEDKKGVFNCYLMLGKLEMSKKNYKEAGEYFYQALPLAQSIMDERGIFEDREDLGAIYHSLSLFYFATGDYEKADRYCDSAISLKLLQVQERGQNDDIKYLGGSYLHKCSIYEHQGAYEEAEKLYLKVLEMDRHNYQTRHSLMDIDCMVVALKRVMAFYTRIGEPQKAQAYSEETKELEKILVRCGIL